MQGEFGWAAWAITLAAMLDLVDTPRLETTFRTAPPHQRLKIAVNSVCFRVTPEIVVFPLFASYTFWGIAESLSPVLREGVFEGGYGSEDDDSSGSAESYRAKSTWE